MVHEKISKLPIFFVLGGPGSGKATVCLKLQEELKFANVNAGGLLRAAVTSGSAKGKEIEAAMSKGELVSNATTLEIIEEYLVQHADNVKGVLVVGYPRSKEQGAEFEGKFGAVKGVLYYHCPDNVRKERLLKAHAHADDNEATIDKRLAAYHAHSSEVVAAYGSKITHIDAGENVSVDTVYEKSKEAITKALA